MITILKKMIVKKKVNRNCCAYSCENVFMKIDFLGSESDYSGEDDDDEDFDEEESDSGKTKRQN